MAALVKAEWHGRSTNALFLVNKEFSGLAASYVFVTLQASRCLDHCFQYFILPHRKHLIRHISLDKNAKKPELERAISLLLLFHIKTLSIHEAATSTLLPDIRAVPFTSSITLATHSSNAVAFRLALATISTLTLVNTSFDTAALIISYGRKLRHLTIRGFATFNENEADRDGNFLAALAGAGSLERLTLDNSEPDYEGDYVSLPQSWDKLARTSSPALRFLDLTTGEGILEARDWKFIENCAQSIQTLHLTTSAFHRSIRPSFGSTVFPHLHTLRITSGDAEAITILSALAASPLTSLSLTFTSSFNLNNTSSLLAALKHHLDNRVNTTITAPPLFIAENRVFRDFCSDHRVALEYGRCGRIFTYPLPSVVLTAATPVSDEQRDATSRELVGAAAEALDLGHRRLERLRLDRDVEGAEEMMGLLAGLAARMRIEED